jgi:hypothetical protein
MLLDSNIIIYAAQPKYSELRRFIRDHSPSVSAISYVEVLGYHRLTQEERKTFEMFFAAATILPINESVLDQAVRLRQARNMSLGDALQAGTALAHGLILVTRDTKDFEWIDGLTLLDPFTTTTP